MTGLPGHNTPPHLDRGWEFMAKHVCVEGTVTGVFYPGDANNPTSESDTTGIIVYQVTVETRQPYGQVVFFPVPAAGQFTGMAVYDQVDPIPEGTPVMVGFSEGSKERPYIKHVFWDYGSDLAEGAASQPRSRWIRRGFEFEVDKNGDVDLRLRDTGQLRVLDNDGNVVLRVLESGSIELGGTSGLQALMTEAMISTYNSHTHPSNGSPPTVGLLSSGSHATAQVKGK